MTAPASVWKKVLTPPRSSYPYLIFTPRDYQPSVPAPFLLFLHGAGEKGSDLKKIRGYGIPRYVEEHAEEFPFVAVCPQCPPRDYWESPKLKDLLEEVQLNYSIDETRMYCTGLSMGGFGTWNFVSDYPNLFAAILPICGGGSVNKVERIKHIPVWIFHGAKDDIVPCDYSRRMKAAYEKVGAKEVRYTEYPDLRHDSWTETYNNKEIYKWLLDHKKAD